MWTKLAVSLRVAVSPENYCVTSPRGSCGYTLVGKPGTFRDILATRLRIISETSSHMEENLLSHSKSNEANVDRSLIKIVILGVLGTISAFLAGYAALLYIDSPVSVQHLWFTVGATSAFLALYCLLVFFVKGLEKVVVLDVFFTVAFVAPFYESMSGLFLLGIVLAAACLMWGNVAGARELRDRNKIHFFAPSRRALGKAGTGLALFFTILYFVMQGTGAIISRAFFDQLLLSGSGIVQSFVPGVSPADTFEQAATSVLMNQLNTAPEFAGLTPQMKREVLAKSLAEFQAKASGYLGISVNPKEKITDILYAALESRLGGLGEPVRRLVVIALAALIFFTLRGIVAIVAWLALVLSFIIYEVLLALGFATVVLESTSREIIIL